MVNDTPIEEVVALMNSGMGDADIIRRLTDKGYSPVEISDALNQAKIKKEISPEGLTPSILTEQPAEEKPIPQIPRSSVPKPMAVPPMQQQMKASQKAEPEQAYQAPYSYPTYQQLYQEEAPQKVDTEAIEEIAEEMRMAGAIYE